MINRVTIRRFKRFQDVTFEVPNHVVLAGPNNCGKTTILQAIAAWSLALDRWKGLHDYQRHRGYYTWAPISRPTFYAVPLANFDALWSARQYRGTLEIEIRAREGWSIGMEFKADSTEQIYVRPKKGPEPQVLRDASLQAVFVPSMTGLAPDEPVYQPPKIEQLLGQGKPGDVIRNLLVEASHSGVWGDLQRSIRRLFQYDILPPDASGAEIVADYTMQPDGPRFEIASAGSGFQQVLMLLTFLYTRPASVLLVDEPDAHLYVILQDLIYNELQTVAIQQKSQLIVATHSEVIINSADPRELCMVIATPRLLADKTDRSRLARAMQVLSNIDVMVAETGDRKA